MSLQDFREVAKEFGWNPEGEVPLVNFIASGLRQAAEAQMEVDSIKKLLVRLVLAQANNESQTVFDHKMDQDARMQAMHAMQLGREYKPNNKSGILVLFASSEIEEGSHLHLSSYVDAAGNVFLSARETFAVGESKPDLALVAPMPASVE